jgi:hypothetical protein
MKDGKISQKDVPSAILGLAEAVRIDIEPSSIALLIGRLK